MLPYLHIALLLLIESWKLKTPNTQHDEDENHWKIIGQSQNESLACGYLFENMQVVITEGHDAG